MTIINNKEGIFQEQRLVLAYSGKHALENLPWDFYQTLYYPTSVRPRWFCRLEHQNPSCSALWAPFITIRAKDPVKERSQTVATIARGHCRTQSVSAQGRIRQINGWHILWQLLNPIISMQTLVWDVPKVLRAGGRESITRGSNPSLPILLSPALQTIQQQHCDAVFLDYWETNLGTLLLSMYKVWCVNSEGHKGELRLLSERFLKGLSCFILRSFLLGDAQTLQPFFPKTEIKVISCTPIKFYLNEIWHYIGKKDGKVQRWHHPKRKQLELSAGAVGVFLQSLNSTWHQAALS